MKINTRIYFQLTSKRIYGRDALLTRRPRTHGDVGSPVITTTTMQAAGKLDYRNFDFGVYLYVW